MFALFHDLVIAPFAEFEFMRRALVGAVALAIAAAPIGVFLMLRRMSLTGDAMAHAILPGAALGYLVAGLSLPAMTFGGLVAGVTVAVGAGAVARASVLKEDTTLAAFYLLSLALGVTIVSLKGSNVDLLHVLFGSVLALDDTALVLIAAIATLTLFAMAAIFRPLVLESVDPVFLRSVGRVGAPVHLIFMALVVLNLVGGFLALGTLLAVGMMMLPAASARLWTDDLTQLVGLAAAIGAGSAVVGLLLSYHQSLPAGPAIILVAGAFYLLSLIVGRRGLLAARIGRRHLEA
ncbi:metal ABC transporter permease [Siculibacillus lacustris]|uniref:Metal ABC transporter permease n=1 Tax=Siculibacillus lacustris TaxID=1549641 RepID=A0A4Q9VZF1_9HYPH|nr:metal ABC transporter permease [Siculibacillus lacustris]TBW40756.1 metal ABC transporter permease [Siculibacillus lacustris]